MINKIYPVEQAGGLAEGRGVHSKPFEAFLGVG